MPRGWGPNFLLAEISERNIVQIDLERSAFWSDSLFQEISFLKSIELSMQCNSKLFLLQRSLGA